MPTFEHGKIYKIVDNTNGNIYIGSTTKPLPSQRLAGHVYNYNAWKKGKYHFVTSFKIFENNNYHIDLLELVPCTCKDELTSREKYHIKNNVCVNKVIPQRTFKEYYQDNVEQIKQYQQQYNQENKEHIKQYQQEYRQQNKERLHEKHTCKCGGQYTTKHISDHNKSQTHQQYLKQTNNQNIEVLV